MTAWNARLAALVIVLSACGGGEIAEFERPARDPGELALPPSANAPRVSRDAMAPDTFRPDSVSEFEVVDLDSFAQGDPWNDPLLAFPGGLDPAVASLADSYRRHYGEALRSGGSAIRGRIDRELQRQAELRTAQEQGYADWISLIEAMTPEQRASLVERLDEANVELARDLHGFADEEAPTGTSPTGSAPTGTTPPGE